MELPGFGDAGDPPDFGGFAPEDFVRSTYEGLFRWFLRTAGCPALAADLTQESYAAFWGSLGRKPDDLPPRVWLYAVGRNLWRKHARDRRGFEPLDGDRASDRDPGPERLAEGREFEAAARDAVARLPDDLREAFTLRFWERFTYEEIGAVQRVSADLARWRYFAARKRLHAALAPWSPESEPARKEDRRAR